MSTKLSRDDLAIVHGVFDPYDVREVTDEEFDRLAREWFVTRATEQFQEYAKEWVAAPENRGDALRALLTDECDNCGGSGVDPSTDYRFEVFDTDCPKCGGRGWIPKDGVLFGRSFNAQGDVTMMLEFPFVWLEAEDE